MYEGVPKSPVRRSISVVPWISVAPFVVRLAEHGWIFIPMKSHVTQGTHADLKSISNWSASRQMTILLLACVVASEMFASLCLLLVFLFLFGVVPFVGLLTMSDRIEQRTVLKFMAKSETTPMDSWRQLHAIYGDRTMSQKTVQVWHKKFSQGHEETKDGKRSGHPRTARTTENIERVREAVEGERRTTVHDLADHLHMKKTAVHTILKKDLGFSKLAPKFVPRILTEEQRHFRVQMCQLNLDKLEEDPDFMKKIITGDESWVSVLELELKKDSKEWHKKGAYAQRPIKALQNRSTKKVMITVFFDHKGVVMQEFKPPQESITAETYCATLAVLKERIRRKRKELWGGARGEHSFFLHHDNASPHTATPTLAFIGSSGIDMVPHPPYSPDLAPCDFFLFPRLKSFLRGHNHWNLPDLRTAVERSLQAIHPSEFSIAMHTLALRWMKCISAEGHYFEGMHIEVDPGQHGLEIVFQSDEDSSDPDDPQESSSDES